jgi:hypothetical protein
MSEHEWVRKSLRERLQAVRDAGTKPLHVEIERLRGLLRETRRCVEFCTQDRWDFEPMARDAELLARVDAELTGDQPAAAHWACCGEDLPIGRLTCPTCGNDGPGVYGCRNYECDLQIDHEGPCRRVTDKPSAPPSGNVRLGGTEYVSEPLTWPPTGDVKP